MKTLLLMRHAKSSWKDSDLTDHQRPLNKRGEKAAPEMGRRLRQRGVHLDAIVSSDAVRAVATAEAVAGVLGLSPVAVRKVPELYDAGAGEILKVIHGFEDAWKRVLVVGHNPGFTKLANRFYPQPIANVPTAGIVEFWFDTHSWKDIDGVHLTAKHLRLSKKQIALGIVRREAMAHVASSGLIAAISMVTVSHWQSERRHSWKKN